MIPPLVREVLRHSGVRFELNYQFEHPEDIRAELRILPYVDQWRRSIANRWFHVRLEDHSLLVFDPLIESYRYIACPLDVPSFREFLISIGQEPSARAFHECRGDYDFVLDTAPLKQHIAPLRYDLDRGAYESGVHPAGHLHIGLDNQIRLGLRREMNSTSFCLFVLRQLYPDNWRRVIGSQIRTRLARYVRDDLTLFGDEFFGPTDMCEVYLN